MKLKFQLPQPTPSNVIKFIGALDGAVAAAAIAVGKNYPQYSVDVTTVTQWCMGVSSVLAVLAKLLVPGDDAAKR
jgi:hypothetical protein